jgi:hypothetical protein
MERIYLQIDNGTATAQLCATQAPTVLPPGRSFVDVTDRDDSAVLGAAYNADTDVFTAPVPAVIEPADVPMTPREQRELLLAIKANTER